MKTTRKMIKELLGIAIAASVMTAAQTVLADVTFTDDTFNDADWDITVLLDAQSAATGAGSGVQFNSGGNSGDYRLVTHTHGGAVPGNKAQMVTVHIKPGAIYDPSSQGAIVGIIYSEDVNQCPPGSDGTCPPFTGSAGQALGPALRQNGNVYISFTGLIGGAYAIAPNINTWVTKPLIAIESNFFLSDTTLEPGGPLQGNAQKPDFSATGSPIEVGFWRGNTNTGFPDVTTQVGIDNWSFTIVQQGCTAPPSDLINWWPGDGDATDIAGSNNGTLFGNATTTPTGKVDQAFSFDGAGYFRANPDFNPGSGDFTFDAWVKTEQTGTNHLLLSDWSGSGGVDAIVLAVGTTGFGCHFGSQVADKATFIIRDGATGHCLSSTTDINKDGKFHHIAAVKAGNTARIYVDGVLENSLSTVGGQFLFPPGTNFNIGGGNGFWLTAATIDEVEIFDRALSTSEIQKIFFAGTEGKCKVEPNQPPEALCQSQNVLVPAELGGCTASASVDAGSSDPDGGAVTLTQAPGGPYALGTTAVTLTVTDNEGASASCSATVEVVDQEPPVIGCPAAQELQCTGSGGASAVFSPTVSDNCTAPTAVCAPASGTTFSLGMTPVDCTASDDAGNASSCSSSVSVVDTTAPTVTAALVRIGGGDDDSDDGGGVRVEFSCSDTCDATAAATATLNGIPVVNGQVVVLGDDDGIFGGDDDSDDDGGGNLELVATCTDASGQVGTATATLLVDDG